MNQCRGVVPRDVEHTSLQGRNFAKSDTRLSELLCECELDQAVTGSRDDDGDLSQQPPCEKGFALDVILRSENVGGSNDHNREAFRSMSVKEALLRCSFTQTVVAPKGPASQGSLFINGKEYWALVSGDCAHMNVAVHATEDIGRDIRLGGIVTARVEDDIGTGCGDSFEIGAHIAIAADDERPVREVRLRPASSIEYRHVETAVHKATNAFRSDEA